jgi:hypothetical protein
VMAWALAAPGDADVPTPGTVVTMQLTAQVSSVHDDGTVVLRPMAVQ